MAVVVVRAVNGSFEWFDVGDGRFLGALTQFGSSWGKWYLSIESRGSSVG